MPRRSSRESAPSREPLASLLCERLKERDIPFVIHSGHSKLEGACNDGVAVGKPNSPQVLVTMVAGLLRSSPLPSNGLGGRD